MGAYTPLRALYSVLNTLMQLCSSLNIYHSGAFEVGYNTPKPRRLRVGCMTSCLVSTCCTRGVQENGAIGLDVLQSAEILCFAIHFLCVAIE